MPAWYDIVGLTSRDNEVCQGLDASRISIQALVDTEIRTGIPSSRIVLGGFSQVRAALL
jgi:predicted esterase